MERATWREAAWLGGVATCLKLLLLPAYRSTDFEVHRHWMAVTHSLPPSEWYFDETSEWTLDYPPLFAWFERLLAYPATKIEPRMVDLKLGLNFASPATIIYMRATVMVSDLVLYYALWRFCRNLREEQRSLVMGAVIFCPALFYVDHIHFQYNGFLLGILLLSLTLFKEGRELGGSVLFAALVCLKHLFAVGGPLAAVYLLSRTFRRGREGLSYLLLLAGGVGGVLLLTFGPFVYMGQMGQVFSRLFPFGRGLSHAYWAPNVWALYNAADKGLGFVLRKFGYFVAEPPLAALTGGLVGDASPYMVLPKVTPGVSLLLVLLSMLPCLVHTWRLPIGREMVRRAAHVYMCGFMLGWHVHEKACLHFLVPWALLLGETRSEDAEEFMFMSIVANYSLFPLLFEAREYPIKVLLLGLYTVILRGALRRHSNGFSHGKGGDPLGLGEPVERTGGGEAAGGGERGWKEHGSEGSNEGGVKALLPTTWSDAAKAGRRMYLLGIVGVELYVQVGYFMLFRERLPFLPLLMVSVYCAVGMCYVWMVQFVYIFSNSRPAKAKV